MSARHQDVGAGSPPAQAVCYLVVPAGPDGRGPAALSGLGWELLVRLRQLADHCCGATHLVAAAPYSPFLWSFDEGRASAVADLARDRPVALLANAAFFLESQPPVAALLAAAVRDGLAVHAGDGSGVVYAVAVRHGRAAQDDVQRALAQLVSRAGAAAQPRWEGRPEVAVLPSREGGVGRRRPTAGAAVYLNAALAEVLYAPADSAPVNRSPERLLGALLAQRDRSAVPWIFNTLANDVEHRLGQPVLDSFPPEMHLSVTGRCNIECRFCSYAHENAYPEYVDVGRLRRLDFLRHLHTLRLSSGLGEPTINPHLPAMLEDVTARHPQLAVNFFTNGTTLLRRGLIDALVDRTAWVNVSLNAATAATWQELCEKDLYDRVTGGLRELQRVKRERGAALPVVYGSMVLTAKNLHELPRMPALCRALGVDRFTAIPFFSYTYEHPAKYGAAESFHHCRDEYDALYATTLRAAEAHGVSVELPLPADEKRAAFGVEVRGFYDFAGVHETFRPLYRLVEHLDYPAGSHCPALWRIAHVGSTDRGHAAATDTHFLYPCLGPLAMVDFSTRTAFDFPDAAHFLELWNNPVFVRLRTAQQRRGVSRVCDACRGMDTRDPDHFGDLDALLREWRAPPPRVRDEELTLMRR